LRIGPANLLEIGCGNGSFLEKVGSAGFPVEGVDINSDAVAAGRAKGLVVNGGDVLKMTGSYDMVVLLQVLEHMENPRQLFELLAKGLVRPGGHLVIAVPNPDGYLKEMGVNLLDMPPHHNSCWGRSTFEQLQARFGWELVEYRQESIRYVHYLGFLQKTIGDHANLTSSSWRKKLYLKVQLLAVRMLAPLTYLGDRERIDGQTHLVVLRNAR